MTANAAEAFTDLRSEIVKIGGRVTADQIDMYARLQSAENTDHVVRTLVEQWTIQQVSERFMRRRAANYMFAFFAAEIFFANLFVYLLGAGILTIAEWMAALFFSSVFAQVAAGAIAVVKYLFPESPSGTSPLVELIRSLREDRDQHARL